MKWMVGYQLCESDDFMQEILRQREKIQEIYFSWGNLPNGRHTALQHPDLLAWQVQQRQMQDLQCLQNAGFSFNLLLNGNCYGRQSLARSFLIFLCDTVEDLSNRYRLVSVTTTSPVIARCLKENFPELEIRASVNMEIGTEQGMDYLSDCFDSYYMKRECNRNLRQIQRLKRWCNARGKKLYMLANSGCFNDCSARQFHDNLVAHENEIREMDNAVTFHGVCADYLERETDKSVFLRRLNFVRPEDMHLYEEYFTAAKLATRVTRYPARILRAYAEGHYSGNILDLLEPNHAQRFYPNVLENRRIPEDFGERVMTCEQDCAVCDYCQKVFQTATVALTKEMEPSDS